MTEHPGLPENVRNAILALIDQYQQRGVITVDELNAAFPNAYHCSSRDIEDALQLIAEGGLQIEWE
ncbi:hypothetical protein EJ076_05275 [Mesorhizobium sp. M7D.F.Ca.US.005.01.1.1]|uniref:RNA polymerase sigma factor region1.1 domain-containing protein n=1 Tax=Mesorhizobium sp. M7D.F.Ca.US.005.01.1.1 TaxID=2493678 RepID=UPI000F764E6F|nr:RNA polymerase sigma factor region1.1 domain-containing protein [Mesorhizobium sp. M7D.F.Ca.US.005.01.1.1]AZO40576.1 hypothetical protein EJ076_05275 [Mesorhizobium sp. M7D.F.Ca.US.005.01.1.1]